MAHRRQLVKDMAIGILITIFGIAPFFVCYFAGQVVLWFVNYKGVP